MSTHRIAIILLLLLYGGLSNVCIVSFFDGQKEQNKNLESMLGIIASSGEEVGSAYASPDSDTILRSNDGLFEVHIPPGAMHDEQEFTIVRYDPSNKAYPGGYFATSPVYDIQPSYVFKKPVKVTLTMDSTSVAGHGADRSRSSAFMSSNSSTNEWAHVPGWQSQESTVNDYQVRFSTKSFSTFGAGSPPPGNLAPVISGAFYYFKPGCSYLPYRVRTNVSDPDGDSFQVYLVVGPAGGTTNSFPMVAEGGGWFRADIPYEAMVSAGIQIQVLAIDQYGNNTTVPTNGVFQYPADSGNPTFVSSYNPDNDGDGYLDAWEVDNGYNPNDPSDPTGIIDSDGDGIPDSADNTPNGEANPTIDAISIVPSDVFMDVGESVAFSVSASNGGSPRFVNASLVTTGNALNGNPVGELNGPVFTANEPGLAGVTATVESLNAVATVQVSDSVGPNNITDLTATAISNTRIRLQWTAPGDDGAHGKAASYEVRRSNSPITDDGSCTAGAPMTHTLVPKNAGLSESLDINGLSPNTTYYFCVRAFDSNGNRNLWNGTVTAQTGSVPDVTPPASIMGATASPLSPTEILLSWNAVGDDGSTGSAASYEIRRSTMPITTDVQCDAGVEITNSVPSSPNGTPLTHTVTNLAENTIYYFCIRSFDDSNNRSSWNSTLVATTMNANDPPIVYAGDNRSVLIGGGQSIPLDGSLSGDPDGAFCGANTGNYIYSWTLLSKPPASGLTNASITGSNSLNASFIPDTSGQYVFQLSFTDDPGGCGGGARTSVGTVYLSVTLDALGPGISPSNFKENSTIESGFLSVSANDMNTVTQLEIALDGGSYQSVPNMSSHPYNYRFQLPTGSATWRKDSIHSITIRATDAAGNVTIEGPITVRKGDNRDVNGDGRPDLLISASHSGGAIGEVFLFYQTPNTYTQADAVFTGGSGGNYFGTSTTLGDVNGDGFADVIVGAHYGETGFVYVFYSTGHTGIPSTTAENAPTRLIGVAEGDHFGEGVAVGDANCDGYTDILVAAMEAGPNHKGAAYLFLSSGSSGIASEYAVNAHAFFHASMESPRFGAPKVAFSFPLALSDLDGDGCSESIMGSRGTEKVYIFRGAPLLSITSASVLNADAIISTPTGINFSRSMAVGDANGDGFMDLAVGAPGYGVFVFHSQGASGIPTQSVATANSTITKPFWGTSEFAVTLDMGDLNNDGADDLAIGDSGYLSNQGRILIAFANVGTGIPYMDPNNFNGIPINNDFTAVPIALSTLEIADVSGDGRKDIRSTWGEHHAMIIHMGSLAFGGGDITDIGWFIAGPAGSQFGQTN